MPDRPDRPRSTWLLMVDREARCETAEPQAPEGGAPRVVAIGADAFTDRPGGLGRYAQDLTAASSTITLIVLGRGDPPAGIIGVSRPDAPLVDRITRVTREVLRADPDVVDVHFALYGLLPVLLRPRRPVVAHHQGPWAEESHSGRGSPSRYGARDLIERFVLRRAHTVVTLSDAFRDHVIDRHGLFPARVVTVPPGVTCPPAGDPHRARSLIGVDDGTPVVVVARRLVARTGVDILLRAWVGVVESEPAAHLVVVGEGPEEKSLRDLAAELGVEATVTFAGRVSDAVLADLWAAAEVAVVPTRALEGFGLVLLEAGCHGTASVVTDVGGLPEVVGRLSPDLVVRADPRSLAVRLRGVLDGSSPPPERGIVRAWARSYDWSSVALRHSEIYRQAVNPTARPRAVIVSHSAAAGGAEIALSRTLAAVRANGLPLDVHVIAFEDGPLLRSLDAMGISNEVVEVERRALDLDRSAADSATAAALGPALATGGLRLLRRLRSLCPDVVAANGFKSGGLVIPAAALMRLPVVWHLHVDLEDPSMHPTGRRVLRSLAALTTATIANSDFTRMSWGLDRDVDVVVHPVHGRTRSAVPEPIGRPTIAMVGRISPWKGQLVLLEALARAFPRDDGEGPRAAIVGAPLFGEDPYLDAVRARASEPDLAGRVTITGFVDDVDAVYDAASIVVHASTDPEPFGQVVIEAMAARRAVISTAHGGVPEIITDGIDGTLVDPGDVNALADALRRLVNDQQLRMRLAAAGERRAADFAPGSNAGAVVEVYRRAAESRRRR
ncbi:MAG: glycosyltransferase family 4 protein [Acidimicrobiales bacterium]